MPDAYANADEVATELGADSDDRGRLTMRRKLWTPSTDPGVILCNGWSRRAYHVVGGSSLDASTRYLAASVARRYMTVGTHDLTFEYSAGVWADGWGNAGVLEKMAETKTWLQGSGGAKAGKISLIGISMGATAALNYALSLGSSAKETIASIALLSPVLDTADVAGVPRDIYLEQSLYYAFGGSESTFAVQGPAYNPQDNLSEINALKIPIHIWYSSDDPIAYHGVTEDFIESSGPYVTGTVVGAYQHSIDDFPMDAIAAWLQRRTV